MIALVLIPMKAIDHHIGIPSPTHRVKASSETNLALMVSVTVSTGQAVNVLNGRQNVEAPNMDSSEKMLPTDSNLPLAQVLTPQRDITRGASTVKIDS
jgi:hypothetical protein